MSLEVRQITTEEIEQAETIAPQAFGDTDRQEPRARIERAQRDYPADWYLAAF
jgi:hypothetical protein